MRLQELGQEIRKARKSRRLTQADLAARVGLSRQTLNSLENGLVKEIGIRKMLALMEVLGIELAAQPAGRPRKPDYVRMACTTAGVSFKSALTEDELVHALLTGKLPASKAAHFRALFDEAPATLLRGLADEARRWIDPGKLERNLVQLAQDANASRKVHEWLKTA